MQEDGTDGFQGLPLAFEHLFGVTVSAFQGSVQVIQGMPYQGSQLTGLEAGHGDRNGWFVHVVCSNGLAG